MQSDFLLSYIMTSQQKNDLVSLLEEYTEDIFKRAARPTPKSLFEKKALEIIYFEIERLKIGEDPMQTESFLKKLLEETKAMPELKITIAISPTEELLVKLKEWAQKYYSNNLVFDIDINPEIIAGAIIISEEGKYIKYSLSDMLDYYFTARKQELVSLL